MTSLLLRALPPLLAACLAAPGGAQAASAWAGLTPTGGVNTAAVRGQGKLVSYDAGAALHVFSSLTRAWHTIDKSPAATVRLFNDCALVVDGASYTAASSYDGRPAPLPVSPSATLLNGANAKNDSILLVQDGGLLHAFSVFTGAWTTRPLGPNAAASVRRHVAIVHSGATLWGMSAFDGEWRDTAAQAVASLSADGTAAFAVGAGLYAFSAHTRRWRRHAALPSAAFARGDDWGLWRGPASALAFSGLLGEFAPLALPNAAITAHSDLFALVQSQGVLHAYSAVTGDALAVGPVTSSVDVGLATALLHVQGGVIGYSALRQQTQLLPVARLASDAGACVGFVSDASGLTHAFSSDRATWTAAPPATLGQAPQLTTTTVALQAPNDCFAFDAAGGQFVSLGGAVLGLAGNATSAPLLAYDAATLYAFDDAQARWRSTARASAGAPTFRVWRTSALVVDGDRAYGVGAQPSRWRSYELGPHNSTAFANSEVAYLVEPQRLLACSMLAEIAPLQQFPYFRRLQPRRAEVTFVAAPLKDASVFAALGAGSAPVSLPGLGELQVDLSAAAVVALAPNPTTGASRLRLRPPVSASLAGVELFVQLLVAPVSGAPYLGDRATVQLW